MRTVDRESADDRLTSATEKTTSALSEYCTIESPDGRQARTSATEKTTRGQTEICKTYMYTQARRNGIKTGAA